MQTRTRSLVRLVVTTLAVVGIAMFAFPAPAQARVKAPRLTSLHYYCGSLQDRCDQILADIWETKQFTDAQRQELQDIGRAWNEVCAGTFGSIVFNVGVNWSVMSTKPGSGVLVVVQSNDMPI